MKFSHLIELADAISSGFRVDIGLHFHLNSTAGVIDMFYELAATTMR